MRRYRNIVIAATVLACAAAAALGSFLAGGRTVLDGVLYDAALAGRARLFGAGDNGPSPVVVVTLDHRSLDSKELRAFPRALMAPVWAHTLGVLLDAGAAAVGFDFLFPYRANDFRPNHDRSFLQILARNSNRVVLGRSGPTPAADYFYAATRRNPNGIALLELEPEEDGVVRSVRSVYHEPGKPALPTLSAALIEAAGAGPMPERVWLAPERSMEAAPHFSLIDVLQCAEHDPEGLAHVFKDRVVLIGSGVLEEDAIVAAGRFLPLPEKSLPVEMRGCSMGDQPLADRVGGQVSGVFVHAEAVRAVLQGDLIRRLPVHWTAAFAAGAAASGAALGFVLVPAVAVVPLLVLLLGLWGGEVMALQAGVWFPASTSIVAAFLATVAAYLVRYLLEDRRRRQIQKAFGRYLAPSVVEQLLESGEALRLGGDTMDVTVMFADLSGFTALSTKVSPKQLVDLTNRYLSLITDEVDAHQGYVDKYIGDASMALWGAPLRSSEHQFNAVSAALTISARIATLRAEAEAAGTHGFGIKIGLCSGPAVVGNVGSERRFNYTAVGETVNIAARLESLPGIYDCAVIVAETTAEAVRDRILLRELDAVTVKGRDKPLSIYEPMATLEAASADERDRAIRYAEGLAAYRSRQFDRAAEIWGALSNDGPALIMQARALQYLQAPPPTDWDGVWRITSK